MIWEAAPLAETRTLLEEMGVATVVFDPCANTPVQGDFLSVMRKNIERMRPVFQRAAQ
jgi:zinc transport system substrate-binding protein